MVKLLNVLGSEKAVYSFISFCLGMLAVAFLLRCAKFHVIDDNDFERIQLQERTQDLNHKYYNYYKSTENLLDSVMEEDNPVLETDCGSKYLDARKAVTDILDEKEQLITS